MSFDYRRIENSLLDILITIKDRLEILNISQDLFDKTEKAISFINSKRYQVAVVGAFKTGKSSLMNALLGTPKLLPEDIIPATATINRIVFGKTINATAFFHDGKKEEISIDDLAKYVAKTTPDGEYLASLIKEVVISLPTVICQNHVEVIDTPGLNDDKKMTAITLRAVEEVDAIILTISQQFQFDEYISKFVYDLIKKASITNIIFVVTHIDELYETLEDEDTSYDQYMEFLKKRIKEKVFEKLKGEEDYLEKAHKLLDADKIQIFGVSSYLYFKYLKTKDTKLLEESQFEEFNNGVIPIITAQQIENAIIKTKDNITEIIEECNSLQNEKNVFFETKINQYEKCAALLESYKNGDRDRIIFRDAFDSECSEYDNCLLLMNKEKNKIAKEFIGALSTIKRNQENDEIRTMLINKFTEIEKEENITILTSIWNQIHSVSQKIFQVYYNVKKEELSEILSMFGNELIDPESRIGSFLCSYVESRISFQWEYCPITKNIDCLHTDLMDLFIRAIDDSIEKLKNLFRQYINNEIPQKVLNIIAEHHIHEYTNIQSKLNENRKLLEEERITFKNNFQEFSEKIPELREKLESVSKEV